MEINLKRYAVVFFHILHFALDSMTITNSFVLSGMFC